MLVAPPVGLRPPYAATSTNSAPVIPVTLLDEGGPLCTPIGGPFWTPIDMREASTPADSSASRCGDSVCDPSALDTLTYPMSIITPPEKISNTLQCAGGFRNGYSDR